MGGRMRGAHQALLMTTVVHVHAAAHRAYHGPRGGGNRPTHFVTLILPRLVRVVVRADFNTRLRKLESSKPSARLDSRATVARRRPSDMIMIDNYLTSTQQLPNSYPNKYPSTTILVPARATPEALAP